MPAKNPPTGTDADLNLSTLSRLFVDEDAARQFLESKRWASGRFCPHCGCTTTYALTPKPESKSPVRPGIYKCRACRKQFSVRIGTIFEESKIPISKWLMALHLMTSSKKGVSSHQIARELGVTQKTAWFLNHRIREAMMEDYPDLLTGHVEMDETYIGPRRVRRKPGTRSKRGRGTEKKPVMVLVERDGRARAMPIIDASAASLRAEALTHVSRTAMIHTDEWTGYRKLGKEFSGGHRTVNHSLDEYSRRDGDGVLASVNTAESYFALLKRGFYGIFHHFSRKHTHRYTAEFSFRWCHRKISDGERMVAAIEGAEGKRLMYR